MGMLLGALVITLFVTALINRFLKRPWFSALLSAAVCSVLFYFGTDGGFAIEYWIASAACGALFWWRARKKITEPSSPAPQA